MYHALTYAASSPSLLKVLQSYKDKDVFAVIPSKTSTGVHL